MTTDSPLHDPAFLLTQDARLRALARRLVHDAAAADDVVQESWMRAMRGTPEFSSRISGWLSGIVRRVAIGAHHENAARTRRERGSEPPRTPPSTEDLLAREAARRAVVDAVTQLPEPARTVIVLRYFEDRSARAIAARLGEPVETIRTRIKRALEQLRRELDRKHGGDGRAWCTALLPIVVAKKAAAGGVVVAGLAAAALFVGTLGLVAQREMIKEDHVQAAAAKPVASSPATSDATTPTFDVARVALDPHASPVAVVSDVTGRVVDSAGRAIEGATLELVQRYHDGKDWRQHKDGTTTTLDDGSFAFVGVPALGATSDKKRTDTLRASHADFVSRWITTEHRAGITIVLERPTRLEGVVRDATSHTPIANVPVALQQRGGFGVGRNTLARTTSDANGRYSFAVARETVVIVCAQPTGFVPTLVTSKLGSDAVTTLDVDIPPMRPVALEMHWLTSRAPCVGLRIAAGDLGPVDNELAVLAVTDENGRCELANIPTTGWSLAALGDHSNFRIGFDVPPLTAGTFGVPVTILVPDPWTVKGRLLEADGTPIVDAAVTIERGPFENNLDRAALVRRFGDAMNLVSWLQPQHLLNATTSADGSFELRDVLSGCEVARITATRHGAKASHVVATVDSPMPGSKHDLQTIVVDRTVSLGVRVVCATADAPGASIVAEHGTTRKTWMVGDRAYLLVRDLEPGTWTLTASSPSLGTGDPTSIELPTDMHLDVTLDLAANPESLVVTRGVALDAEGRPATRASLVVRQAFGATGGSNADDPIARAIRPGQREFHVDADADGRFELSTPRAHVEDLRFTFANGFQVCVAVARPGSENVVVRQSELVRFRLHFVDVGGWNVTTPVSLEWEDAGRFLTIPNDSGFAPNANGILEYTWPKGQLTLRVRRVGTGDDDATTVDVDVGENDDRTAPTIVLR